MHRIYEQIVRAIKTERIVFTIHADNQLAMRRIVRWQVVEGFEDGRLKQILPHAKPYPKIIMQQLLADGSEIFVVWSYIRSLDSASVVTVFFPENR